MTSFRRKRLGDILAAKGIVTAERINEALARGDNRAKRIGEILLAEGIVTEEHVAQGLAEQRDLRYVDLTEFRIAPALSEATPLEIMHRYQFVPIEDNGEVLVVTWRTTTSAIVIWSCCCSARSRSVSAPPRASPRP
jgi:type IV pilus assembly protein PilB